MAMELTVLELIKRGKHYWVEVPLQQMEQQLLHWALEQSRLGLTEKLMQKPPQQKLTIKNGALVLSQTQSEAHLVSVRKDLTPTVRSVHLLKRLSKEKLLRTV